jgi:hypothetical protein
MVKKALLISYQPQKNTFGLKTETLALTGSKLENGGFTAILAGDTVLER